MQETFDEITTGSLENKAVTRRFTPSPDSPHWSIWSALMVWAGSVAAILFVPMLAFFAYAAISGIEFPDRSQLANFAQNDPTAIAIQIAAIIPAHLLTFLMAWYVVTSRSENWRGDTPVPTDTASVSVNYDEDMSVLAPSDNYVEDMSVLAPSDNYVEDMSVLAPNDNYVEDMSVLAPFSSRPFFKSLGWSSGGVKFWHYPVIVVGFYVISILTLSMFPGNEDELTRIIRSSRAALYLITFTAVFTAPIVEEIVYRGLIYSAFLRRWGFAAAILVSTLLFSVVHIPQYYENPVKIVLLTALSLTLTLMRAYSGNLLPCIILHTLVNASQSALLLAEPYLERIQNGV